MFNTEQRAHMRYLATIPPTEKCWSGWCMLNDAHGVTNSYKFCSSGSHCPLDVSLADRQAWACEVCGNYPDPITGRFTHNAGCSRDKRRAHYETIEIGGEA